MSNIKQPNLKYYIFGYAEGKETLVYVGDR
jgi:hypothetical protein